MRETETQKNFKKQMEEVNKNGNTVKSKKTATNKPKKFINKYTFIILAIIVYYIIYKATFGEDRTFNNFLENLTMAIFFIYIIYRGANKNKINGKKGEQQTIWKLNRLSKESYTVLNDLNIPYRNNYSQIDHVVVSNYGIFVIETKNYQGWIFGSKTNKNWKQVIYKKKYSIYNPLLQNNTHINALKTVLSSEYKYYSIVTFTNKATLKNREQLGNNVIYSNELVKYIESFDTYIYSNAEKENIVNKINNSSINDKNLLKEFDKTKFG